MYEIPSTTRAYLPLAPINLTVNGDGHCPTYSSGESVVVDWDMASPLRNLHPVEEDCPSHFADATKLQILDVRPRRCSGGRRSPQRFSLYGARCVPRTSRSKPTVPERVGYSWIALTASPLRLTLRAPRSGQERERLRSP